MIGTLPSLFPGRAAFWSSSQWRQWYPFLIFMVLFTAMDAVGHLYFQFFGIILSVMAAAGDLLMIYGYWRLASLIRLKRQKPELFESDFQASEALQEVA